jgi:hypothetical protein
MMRNIRCALKTGIQGGWKDVGIKFQEGGGSMENEEYMNSHG